MCWLFACDRLDAVQSAEELKDVYQHFMLHHHREVVEMRNAQAHASGDQNQSRDRGESLSPYFLQQAALAFQDLPAFMASVVFV